MDVIAKRKITDAAELLEFLQDIQKEGRDLRLIYLLDREGAEVDEVALLNSRLTDGSAVTDIRFYFLKS